MENIRINETFKNMIMGKETSREGNVFTRIYQNGKFIVKMEVERDYANIIEIRTRNYGEVLENSYKVDKIVIERTVDSEDNIIDNIIYEFKGNSNRSDYIASKEVIDKFSDIKSFKSYAKSLTYKYHRCIDFYTPEYTTTVRTITKYNQKDYDTELTSMIKKGWELVGASTASYHNTLRDCLCVAYVATLKKYHDIHDIV